MAFEQASVVGPVVKLALGPQGFPLGAALLKAGGELAIESELHRRPLRNDMHRVPLTHRLGGIVVRRDHVVIGPGLV